MDAAIAAPSGKNGQPWRFSVISDSTTINEISKLSIYGHWMKDANKFICVYLDKKNSYHYVKDVQSCGAAIQNILLTARALGIETCWIGEILAKSDEVMDLLELDNARYELMAVIVLGHSDTDTTKVIDKEIDNFILNASGEMLCTE